MRIRTIKPEFWTDKRVATWDDFTRLFYIGLWSASDDHGRGCAEPARLAAELFPYDMAMDSRDTLAKVSRALDALSVVGRINLYQVGGEQFFEVVNWTRHQKVDKPGKSRIPESSHPEAKPIRDTLATPSRLDQGTGIREQGSIPPAPPPENDEPDEKKPEPITAIPRKPTKAEDIYALYPRKVAKAAALKAIERALKSQSFDFLLDRTKAYAAAVKMWPAGEEQFVPYPASWFNRGSYDDDPATWRRVSTAKPAQPEKKPFTIASLMKQQLGVPQGADLLNLNTTKP